MGSRIAHVPIAPHHTPDLEHILHSAIGAEGTRTAGADPVCMKAHIPSSVNDQDEDFPGMLTGAPRTHCGKRSEYLHFAYDLGPPWTSRQISGTRRIGTDIIHDYISLGTNDSRLRAFAKCLSGLSC